MVELKKCSHCGAELAPDAPGNHCLNCLLQLGLATADVSTEQTELSGPGPLDEKAGARIGRYKLLQQIGEGGCGVVYMAEQEEPVRRRVALKIIKLGMDTRQVIARFEAERQALAMMDHPNIARVFDAGTTESGRPFFVMELVRGFKINEYCDREKLSTHERLNLFIKVCQAVQHAHQKGIIHRDLKPSNILITEQDGEPLPKVIDFGIAKATGNQPLTDKTLFTAFEQFIGTPAYMSPEQAGLGGLDIDTRSDIYSLGVLLYELLTGQPPFNAEELRRAAIDEVLRAIREKEPPRPSTRLATLTQAELTLVAQQRQTVPSKLPTLLRGDLDWIVLKTMEKDRSRRYETANGLAADLQRYLKNEPVVARPPGNLYRFQRLLQRNKIAFLAASAVTAALIIGLGVSIYSGIQERQARQRADIEAQKSRQVSQFLEDMLQGVGPSVALGRDTTLLREILNKTAVRLDRELTNQPEVEVELRTAVGDTYSGIHDYEKAELMYRQALAIQKKLSGNESLEVGRLLSKLGASLSYQSSWGVGRLDEAEKVAREGLALQAKYLDKDDGRLIDPVGLMVDILYRKRTNLDEAAQDAWEVVRLTKKAFGQDSPDVTSSLRLVGNILLAQGKLAEAEAILREEVASQLKINDPTQISYTYEALGFTLEREGKAADAEVCFRNALEIWKKLLGADSQYAAIGLIELARVIQEQGRFAEAELLHRQAADIARKLQHVPHLENFNDQLTRYLADVPVKEGKLVESSSRTNEVSSEGGRKTSGDVK